MRRLGKFVIMAEREFNSFAWLNDDIQNEIKFWHEESAKWDAERANRRAERKAAFLAGKFHASGGYAHALKETRLRLQGTTAVMMRFMDLCAKWRPLVEALESYPNQFVEISFDAGMHFPTKRFNKDGTEYVASVQYQDKEYPDHSHDLMRKFGDMSDPAAPADFEAVGAEVAQERRQP